MLIMSPTLADLRRYHDFRTDPADIDVPLLRKTLDAITADPTTWNQGTWAVKTSCGTAACLAGTACLLSGDQIDWNCADPFGDDMLLTDHLVGGRRIASRAAELFGIEGEDAAELFSSHNTLGELWVLAYTLTDGAIEIPPLDAATTAEVESAFRVVPVR